LVSRLISDLPGVTTITSYKAILASTDLTLVISLMLI